MIDDNRKHRSKQKKKKKRSTASTVLLSLSIILFLSAFIVGGYEWFKYSNEKEMNAISNTAGENPIESDVSTPLVVDELPEITQHFYPEITFSAGDPMIPTYLNRHPESVMYWDGYNDHWQYIGENYVQMVVGHNGYIGGKILTLEIGDYVEVHGSNMEGVYRVVSDMFMPAGGIVQKNTFRTNYALQTCQYGTGIARVVHLQPVYIRGTEYKTIEEILEENNNQQSSDLMQQSDSIELKSSTITSS